MIGLTPYHAKYFAHELTKRCPSDSIEKLASALVDAQVDLNPHQIEAALFAMQSVAAEDYLTPAEKCVTGQPLQRSWNHYASAGRIKIAVYGLSLPLPTIDDGLIATVRLQPRADQPLAGLSLVDAALGSDAGRNTPVDVAVNGVQVKPLIYLPAVLH